MNIVKSFKNTCPNQESNIFEYYVSNYKSNSLEFGLGQDGELYYRFYNLHYNAKKYTPCQRYGLFMNCWALTMSTILKISKEFGPLLSFM